MKSEINFLCTANKAKVVKCSSFMEGCNSDNVLNNDRKTIWLSEEGLPQFLIIDLTKIKIKPEVFKCFGVYCWHAYPTNPKLIELLFSKDNINYNSLGNFDLELKPGIQLFFIEDLYMKEFDYLKIHIKESHGGGRIYINNIFLFEDFPESDSIIIADSRERNMPRKADVGCISKEKRKEVNIISSRKKLVNYNFKTESSINNKEEIVEEQIIINNENESNLNDYILLSENNYLISDCELSTQRNDSTIIKNTLDNLNINLNNNINNSIKKENSQIEKLFSSNLNINKNDYEDENNKILKNSTQSNHSKINTEDLHQSISYSNKSKMNTPINNPINLEFDNFNYKILEEQLREMQSQLNELNMNTERMKSLNKDNNEDYLNDIIKDDSQIYLANNYNESVQIGNFSPLLSPCGNLSNTKIKFNVLENYLHEEDIVNDLINNNNLGNDDIINPKINIENCENNYNTINSNSNDVNNDKIDKIENKIYSLESDVATLKLQMNQLSESLESFINNNKNENSATLDIKNNIKYNNHSGDKNIKSILDECKKFINNSFNHNFVNDISNYSNSNSNLNLKTNFCTGNTRIPSICEKTISNLNCTNYKTDNLFNLDNNRNSLIDEIDENQEVSQDNNKSDLQILNFNQNKMLLEQNLNKTIDDKFIQLSERLEKRIYKCLLKPAVEKIENNLKGNINELFIHLKNIENKKKHNHDNVKNKKDNRISVVDKLANKFNNKLKGKNSLNNLNHTNNSDKNIKSPKRNYNLSINSFTDTYYDA